jgi:NADH-quinone oxidoreductase subunit G
MPESDVPVVDGVAVEINGVEVIARKGELLIDAAERAGSYIPRFCYHERMKPVGMCRMCLVEVDTGRGPALQPSCMIECTPGMKADTESAVTKKAQDGVLEFLLINHPLDCPVCDKGGECPLQDQTMAYGPGESRMVEEKRHKEKPIPISDLVLLDRERCILCDRCTRFAKDVAGDPLIHFIHRGNDTEVNTFPDEPFASYFSGNTVQICPVGALTASTYRFKARPWDLETTESTCQTCSVGCRISIDSSRDQVQRFSGVDVDPVNWGWLCDKGRFASDAVISEDRLSAPLVRTDEGLVATKWSDALRRAADALAGASSPQSIGVIGGARLTNEDAYAWSKLVKGVLGSDNVDAQLGDGLPAEVVLGLPRATIDDVCAPGGTVVLISPDVKEELPVLFLRLRHAAVEDGVTIIEVSARSTAVSALARSSMQPRPGETGELVRALVAAGAADRPIAGVDAEDINAARDLLAAASGPLTVVLGRPSVAESPTPYVDAAAALLEARPDTTFLSALRRSNVHGALDMGLAPGLLPGRVTLDDARDWYSVVWPTVPAARGLDAEGILRAAADGRIDVLVLLGSDPLADFPDADLAERGLTGARTVISVDTVLNGSSRRADLVLAAAGFAEKAGTTTNLEGRVSTLSQRVTPPGTARADWMLAGELAVRLGSDLGFTSFADVLAEISAVVPSHLALDQALADGAPDGVLLPLDVEVVDEEVEVVDGEVEVVDGEVEVVDGEVEVVDSDVIITEVDASETIPPFVTFVAGPPMAIPPKDSYGFRLIASRKLYDLGTIVQSAPALAGLAPGSTIHLHPWDFDRLGVETGGRVTVRTATESVTVAVFADVGVPRGVAAMIVNQADGRVSDLIRVAQPITEVRIETAS